MDGRTRLVKELFLLGREAGLDSDPTFYRFTALNVGPHSNEAVEDLESLLERKIVRELQNEVSLAPDQVSFARHVAEKHPPELLEQVSRVKSKYNAIPLVELLYYIHFRLTDGWENAEKTGVRAG